MIHDISVFILTTGHFARSVHGAKFLTAVPGVTKFLLCNVLQSKGGLAAGYIGKANLLLRRDCHCSKIVLYGFADYKAIIIAALVRPRRVFCFGFVS